MKRVLSILCTTIVLLPLVCLSQDPSAPDFIAAAVEEEVEVYSDVIESSSERTAEDVARDITAILNDSWIRVAASEEISPSQALWVKESIRDVVDSFNTYGAWSDEYYEKQSDGLRRVSFEGLKAVIEADMTKEDLRAKATEYQAFMSRVKEYIAEYYDGKRLHVKKSVLPEEITTALGFIRERYRGKEENFPKAAGLVLSAYFDAVIQGKHFSTGIEDEWTENIFFGGYVYARMRPDDVAWEQFLTTFDSEANSGITIAFPMDLYVNAKHYAVAEEVKGNTEGRGALSSTSEYTEGSDDYWTFTYHSLDSE